MKGPFYIIFLGAVFTFSVREESSRREETERGGRRLNLLSRLHEPSVHRPKQEKRGTLDRWGPNVSDSSEWAPSVGFNERQGSLFYSPGLNELGARRLAP
jgi:hypothetical protein